MRLAVKCLAAVVASGLAHCALAQKPADNYPSRPVTIIVPLAPGAGVDIETRLYATKLGESLRGRFIIDYRPGAGGILGTAHVAKAAPDGYTLLSTSPGYTTAAALYKSLPYDPVKDLVPVSQMSRVGYPLLVHPAVPAKNLKEYVALTKPRAGGVNFGTSGQGGFPHLLGEWLHSATGARATFVHYKGGAPSFTAVMAGEVDAVFGGFAAMIQHIRSGKVRAIGVTTAERSRLLPDVPTLAEQGAKGFDAAAWVGFFAPAGTPPAIVNLLGAELARIARDPEVTQRVERDGGTTVGGTPAEFRQIVLTEIDRWRKLAKQVGLQTLD
jgi:tripartite-type tricarboxylate transporter receptor subunit TctC